MFFIVLFNFLFYFGICDYIISYIHFNFSRKCIDIDTVDFLFLL
jgi:hypothetical protein